MQKVTIEILCIVYTLFFMASGGVVNAQPKGISAYLSKPGLWDYPVKPGNNLNSGLDKLFSDFNGIREFYKKREPVDGIRIAWDYSTMESLAPMGGYARLLRLADHSIAFVYEDWAVHNRIAVCGNTVMIRSYDEGRTWSAPTILFPWFRTTNPNNGLTALVGMYNPEIIQLQNGDILVAANFRPHTMEVTPYAIALRRSTDNGATWSDIQVLYEGEPRFIDGCWEPAFLQLPGGEVQIYFANEKPYTHSREQEISVISSYDNGQTWGDFRTVSFRKNCRDGMPVPRVVGNEIVVAIEDNKTGSFRPYTVRTTIDDNWSAPVLGDSPGRDYSLKEPLVDTVVLGAPYLLVLSTGETVLSYQSTQGGRPAVVRSQIMQVVIGDKTARNFDRTTQPFPLNNNQQSMWNSIALWDEKTIVAVGQVRLADVASPTIIKGRILSDITVNQKDITDYPIFVGAKAAANLRVGLGADGANLYIHGKVSDPTPFRSPAGTQKGDGIYLLIDSQNASLQKPDKGIYKLWCSDTGALSFWEGQSGGWAEQPASAVSVTASPSDTGYDLYITIPKNILGGLSKTARIGAGLSNDASEHAGYTEFLIHGDMDASNTWMKVTF
ncbi:MAG: exo-alpha-sialidase [Bacteroidales bacterium]|nr:exo-alpha-sialidase [Bacteroidales bacterium]